MASKSKFLVLNPDPTKLDSVLSKANLQNSKNGPFEAILLLGDVLPDASKVPETKIDGSTYFSSGKSGVDLPQALDSESNLIDIKPNLTYMKSPLTILKLASGFRIGYLSADAETESAQEKVKVILDQAPQIDILISYSWPYAIAREEKLSTVGNRSVDIVVKKLQPRYHFAVGNGRGKHFEFQPFQWNQSEITTRFISLGQEGSGDKWFYAFSLNNESVTLPKSQLIENPFTKETTENTKKRNAEDLNDSQKPTEVIVKKPKVVNPDECFFCLSNPKVETHMIISIGSQAYLTVAKGPLTRSSKELPFSGHAIIIPIEHIPTIRSTTPNTIESPIFKEIENYKRTLAKAFSEKASQFKLVFFEISRSQNIHQHVQLLPIPEYYVEEQFPNALEEKTRMNNENFTKNGQLEFKKYSSDQDPELVDIINNSDYISFTIIVNDDEKLIYISKLEEDKAVDLQFPRRVLAFTLKCPKRTYWDKCQQPRFKEAKDCEEFKKFYKDFDFTLS